MLEFKKTITQETITTEKDIYGDYCSERDKLAAAGYEIVAFRPPVCGDRYWQYSTDWQPDKSAILTETAVFSGPRYILRKTPKPTTPEDVYGPGARENFQKSYLDYEIMDFRQPKINEKYVSKYSLTMNPTILVCGNPENEFAQGRATERFIVRRSRKFTFDGVEFEAPEGYRFVRVGFVKDEEKNRGYRIANITCEGRVCPLWSAGSAYCGYAIFAPEGK